MCPKQIGGSAVRAEVGRTEVRKIVVSEQQSAPHGLSEVCSNGWMIGSGAVESACKTVVGQRLKQAGMRWRL